jgi:hypothetical protein
MKSQTAQSEISCEIEEKKKTESERNEEAINALEDTLLLQGMSPRANYTDRATAACQRSNCQILGIKGATWSA